MYNTKSAGFNARFYLLLLFFLLSSCKDKSKYNVIIVTFDTTRADHIASYNDDKNIKTPNLDKLATDGVVYEKSIAPVPITLPSHSSIMTGKVPFTHGVRDNGLFNLPQSQNTLAEILKQNNYQTAAAIGSFPLTSKFGINQGFDYYNEHITQKYEDISGNKTKPKNRLFFDERKAAQVNKAILPWLQDNYQSPFFMWLHYFDPHHPHEPPAPYNQSFVHDLYQGEIAYSDENFGKLIAELKKLGVYKNSIIVFTSDHGEGIGEHNESTHALLMYNSTLHVPLIIKYPNSQFAQQRISQQVGSIDIFPTILNILGINIPDDIQGHILPTDPSLTETYEYYAETLSPRLSHGWGEQRGILKDGYKYIYGPQKELYNLNNDPHELNNIIEHDTRLAKSMKQSLQDYLDENIVSDLNSSIEVDAKTMNTLRGLGYVQSSGEAVGHIEEKLNDTGDAPQLHSDTISSYSKAKNLVFRGKYLQALRYLDALLINDAKNLAYLELKIKAELGLGNSEKAKTLIEELPKHTFGSLDATKRLNILAGIAMDMGNYIMAKSHYEDAENIQQTVFGQLQLAKIAVLRKDFFGQQQHLNNVIKFQPRNVNAINELAISYSLSGDVYLSELSFEKAIKANPYNHLSYYNYGTLLNSINDFKGAEIQFNKTIEIQNNNLKAYYALIEVLIKQKQKSKANKALTTLKSIAPDSKIYQLSKKLMELNFK